MKETDLLEKLGELYWMEEAERIAKERYDGHYTIMRFTTNWRFCWGTVADRDDIDAAYVGATMMEAMREGIIAAYRKPPQKFKQPFFFPKNL